MPMRDYSRYTVYHLISWHHQIYTCLRESHFPESHQVTKAPWEAPRKPCFFSRISVLREFRGSLTLRSSNMASWKFTSGSQFGGGGSIAAKWKTEPISWRHDGFFLATLPFPSNKQFINLEKKKLHSSSKSSSLGRNYQFLFQGSVFLLGSSWWNLRFNFDGLRFAPSQLVFSLCKVVVFECFQL